MNQYRWVLYAAHPAYPVTMFVARGNKWFNERSRAIENLGVCFATIHVPDVYSLLVTFDKRWIPLA